MAMGAPCIGANIHIDCGSVESAPWAAEEFLRVGTKVKNADAFFLTHFHYDHYNGVVWLAGQNGQLRVPVQAAYYPRIPNVVERPELRFQVMRCMLAFGCYEAAQPSRLLLGDRLRFTQRHYAEVIRRVGGCPRGCLGLAQGDTVRGTRGQWEVLWPPYRVSLDSPYGRVMQNGVDAFNAAAEVDDELRKAFEETAEAGLAEEYNAAPAGQERNVTDDQALSAEREYNREGDHENLPREVEGETAGQIEALDSDDEAQNTIIRRANHALRNVGDEFSLAFQANHHVLFLGDLKSREIENVVNLCSHRGCTQYNLLVSSHHGTRWHESLRHLSVRSAVVSSVGGKLRDLVRPQYGSFGVPHYLTCKHGHLALPA